MTDPHAYGSRKANPLSWSSWPSSGCWDCSAPDPRACDLSREQRRSAELNHVDREANSAGYYEGLIAGAGGGEGGRTELALRMLGKPATWVRFDQSRVAHVLSNDFLQFELMPNVNRSLFGQKFTTNALGLRDRPYKKQKPRGVFRIALLGSSMDMGWGIATEDTYENKLEDWLNQHARRRGLNRRFEVLNFGVAAYGPAQRLEVFRRKVAAYHPDLVLYSETRLDSKLQLIHLRGLLRGRLDLKYDFLEEAYAKSGLTRRDLDLDLERDLKHKDRLDSKLGPWMGDVADPALETLAEDCRERGLPLVCVLIPRVGKADSPKEREADFRRRRDWANSLGLPVIDLSAAFDETDPAARNRTLG